MITARPFVPFLIKMTGSHVFTVKHPENASCDLRGRSLTVHDEEGMHMVEMLLVEAMEPVNASVPNGGNGD